MRSTSSHRVPFQVFQESGGMRISHVLAHSLCRGQEQLLDNYPAKKSTVRGTHYNPCVVAAWPKQNFTASAESCSGSKGKVVREHP